jgi:GNAT superfamily N-acetyltransferase
MSLINIHDWDSQHFGFVVARLSEGSSEALREAMDICWKEGVRLVISRFSTDNIHFAQELEGLGFQLMDTVTRYRLSLSNMALPAVRTPATIRPCLVSEAQYLADMATDIYVNHMGHFHNDPRLDRDKCNSVYAELIRNSCIKDGFADLVLVAEIKGKVVGFHSHRVEGDGLAGIISGVTREAQGYGIGKALILVSADWGRSQGLKWIEEYPHLNNYPMHGIMTSLQFKMQSSSYTFHKWLDTPIEGKDAEVEHH